MTCKACGGEESAVLSTTKSRGRVSRKRRCLACNHEWVTVELPREELTLMQRALEMLTGLNTLIKELSHG